MKKIEYEVLKFDDKQMAIRITGQTEVGCDFGDVCRTEYGKIVEDSDRANAFVATVYGKQVILASVSNPANEYADLKTFWMRGDWSSHNDDTVTMTSMEFILFAGAVQKYNEHFADAELKAGIRTRKCWVMVADGKYIDSYSNPQTRATVTAWCEDRIKDSPIREIKAYPYDESHDVIIVRNAVVERVVKENKIVVVQ